MDQMDIDDIYAAKRHYQPSKLLLIDDNHPFEYDQYISNYSGRSLVDRLLFLIQQCPSLVVQATQTASQQIRALRDPSLYAQLITAYDQAAANAPPELTLPPFNEVSNIDTSWLEETNRRNQEERTKLEVELKTYSSNMIKESIRVGGVFPRSEKPHP